MDEKIEKEEEEKKERKTRELKHELVSVKGNALVNGKLSKSNYFSFIKEDLDDYDDVYYTPEEAVRISKHMQKLSTGSTAMIPLRCGGELCPFKDYCILFDMGKVPIGKQCQIENTLLKQWTVNYLEEFDVNPENFTEITYVNELAEIMVLERRLNINIAKCSNAELITEVNVGVDREGDPITQQQISPFMELKEKLSSRRNKIVKLMAGDRQEKYKKESALKIKEGGDPSGKMSIMKAQLDGLSRQLNTIEGKGLSPEDIINE